MFSAAIAVLCIIASYPSVSSKAYFLGDDFGLVHHLHDKPLARFLSYFVSDWTEGIYGFQLDELRPWLAFSYRFDSLLLGAANPIGYHITNVLLHYLNCLMVGAIAFLTRRDRCVALLAAALFAIAPSNAESIAWISGRVDSLAAVFYLAAFLLFVLFRVRGSYHWYACSLTVFGLGLFAKQSLFVLPLLLVAYDLVYDRAADRTLRARLVTHVPFFVVLALHLCLRFALFGQAVRENQMSIEMLRGFAANQVTYLRYLLLPLTSTEFTLPAKIAAAVAMAAIYAVAIFWMFARKARDREAVRQIVFFGPLWYAVAISPLVVTYISARHLYIPSAGTSIAVAALILPKWLSGSGRAKLVSLLLIASMLVLEGIALHHHTGKWVRNGLHSRVFASELPKALRSIPPGAVVVIDVPSGSRDIWMWFLALPFALQKPFSSEDLYQRYAVIEPENVYCCPRAQWWQAKKQVIESLLHVQPGEQATFYLIRADEETGSPIVARRAVTLADLARRLEGVLDMPAARLANEISPEQAEKLVKNLGR